MKKICPNCGKEFNKNQNKYCSRECFIDFIRMGESSCKCNSPGSDGDLRLDEWDDCLKYFNHRCAYCGNERSEKFNLEKDHFIASFDNGRLDKDNVIPACKSCNTSKGKNDPLNWYKQQEIFSKERLKKILEYLDYI